MSLEANKCGLCLKDYDGSKSTLCLGCGHDSVSQSIQQAMFLGDIPPWQLVKLSGIGCSSKSPAYFSSGSHSFNSIHGRMAPMATGVSLANRNLICLGISGDGDTASIGLGGFTHMIRRNPKLVYVVENNGVYGLTKGQFSATSDQGSIQKSGEKNPFVGIDLCRLALEQGCGFVARAFSGDKKQVTQLLLAAFHHRGTALIDVISPCVTFNNHPGSTKSFSYVKEHHQFLHELGFVPEQTPIEVQIADGEMKTIELFDGSHLRLRKLDQHLHDPTDFAGARSVLDETSKSGTIVTGLIYINEAQPNLHESLNLSKKKLIEATQTELSPKPTMFAQWLEEFK